MPKRAICILIVGSLVSACAQALKPLEFQSFAGANESCGSKSGIALSVCQSDLKSAELSSAYFAWQNDPALFDVPLMVLAATAAGLLLFDAHIDAVKATGLAAGTIAAGRSYLTPTEIRAALLDGSNGYSCLADAGRIVESDQGIITSLAPVRSSLGAGRNALNRNLGAVSAAQRLRAEEAVTNADSAMRLYDAQAVSSKFANSTMRTKARAISTGLLRKVERKPINFSELYQTLAQNAATTASQASAKAQAQPPAAPRAPGLPAPRTPGSVEDVERLTHELLEVPDIATAVGKFDDCLTSALSGSTTKQ